MKVYQCKKCLKEFIKKSHLDEHLNKKKPCGTKLINETNDFNEVVIIKENIHKCEFCNKNFSRSDNLKKHILEYCKDKKIQENNITKLQDELTFIKELLLKNNSNNQITTDSQNTTTNTKSHNTTTNSKNTTNTNSLNTTNSNNTTNNVQVNICAFGKEDIDKLDIPEAMRVYLKSTGGNIIPNMLKYINLNEKYPENHNIYMTDNARELVKINNGKQMLLKKFKNAKYEIVGNVTGNINTIVDKFKESNYTNSKDINDKININNMSLKIINGEELFVSDSESSSDSSSDDSNMSENTLLKLEEERKIKKEEKYKKFMQKQQRQKYYDHLNSKRDGLQEITFEKLKEELYNGKNICC